MHLVGARSWPRARSEQAAGLLRARRRPGRAPSRPSMPSPRLASMQEPILYLSADDVNAAMPPVAERLELAERTMTALVADVELPPKIGVHPRPAGSFAHAMPASLRPSAAFPGSGDLLGIKWVTGFPENRAKGIPAIH